MRTCAIIHPLHLELETAKIKKIGDRVLQSNIAELVRARRLLVLGRRVCVTDLNKMRRG
jgi:hypothetical protein